MTTRAWILLAIVIAAFSLAGWSVWRAASRSIDDAPPLVAIEGSAPIAEPYVVFVRQAGAAGHDGALGIAPLRDLEDRRYETRLRCGRVHMAGGRGVCLAERDGFVMKAAALIFDEAYRTIHELELPGLPSRAQVSPTGRYAGLTVFVSGHSYLEAGFSTRTSLLDLETGRWLVEDFESLDVRRNGEPFKAIDFNFWGVTFASDSRTFYVTLGTGGMLYLLRGSVGSGRLDVIAEGVECPSLSPDNRRVGFKQRLVRAGSPEWQLQVLDLVSGARVTLSETRHVDDQVQWLDDRHVLYGLRGSEPGVLDTWVVPADGSGEPRLFLPASYSAAVVGGTP